MNGNTPYLQHAHLTATGIDVGLLINFGEHRVEVRRKVRILPAGSHPAHPVHPVEHP